MTNDTDAGLLRVHPSIPHYLVCKEVLLLNPQGIHLTAATVVLGPTVMGIRFRKYNVNAAGAYPFTSAGPFIPELKPAFYIFYGMRLHIAVIDACILAIIQRPVAIFVKW